MPPHGKRNRTSWRHHYLPQFYLRAWTGTDGRVCEYSRSHKGSMRERRVVPKSTAFAKDLYSTASTLRGVEEHEPDEIETKLLAPLDDMAAKVHRKLLASPILIDDEDRKVWATFINAQLERGARLMSAREEVATKTVETFMEELRSKSPSSSARERLKHTLERFDHVAAAKNLVRTHLVNELRDRSVLDYLNGQAWRVVGAPEGAAFVTGDEPVVVNAGSVPDRPIDFLSFALSPDRLFLLTPRDATDEETAQIEGQMALAHVFAIATGPSRFVYSKDAVADGPWGTATLRLRTALERRLSGDDPE
jgi:hypothetical protein